MRHVMERAPQKWQASSPWTALALAVVFQAKQDVRRGARFAGIYLSPFATEEEKREAIRGMWACRARSAAAFFDSSLWHLICGQTSSGEVRLPDDFAREIRLVQRALRRIAKDQRKAG